MNVAITEQAGTGAPAQNLVWATRMDTRCAARALATVYAATFARLAAEEESGAESAAESRGQAKEGARDPARHGETPALPVAAVLTLPVMEGLLDILHPMMAAHGHSLVVRDKEGLRACMARTETAAAYEGDLAALAAGLFEGIAVRHPLQDGNKRLSTLAALVFCSLNGEDVDVDPEQLFLAASRTVARRDGIGDLRGIFARCARPGALASWRAAQGVAWLEANKETISREVSRKEANGAPVIDTRVR